MSAQSRIYAVEHDPAIRDLIDEVVGSLEINLELFDAPEKFLAVVAPDAVGTVVSDLEFEDSSVRDVGELLVCLRKRRLPLPVIVLAARLDVSGAVAAMRQGAANVVEFPCTRSELRAAIRQGLEADRQYRQRVERRLTLRHRLATLTSVELEVLDYLLQGKPNKAIARALDSGLRTVELRRQSLMKKMQVRSLAALIQAVVEARQEDD